MTCNHVWRDTSSSLPKESKEELLKSIKNSNGSGWWLRGIEFEYASELFEAGLIRYCKDCSCFREAVFAI